MKYSDKHTLQLATAKLIIKGKTNYLFTSLLRKCNLKGQEQTPHISPLSMIYTSFMYQYLKKLRICRTLKQLTVTTTPISSKSTSKHFLMQRVLLYLII